MAPSVAACSSCSSLRVYPRIWVQGFFPTINAERQVYVCRDCGHEGMLLEFESEEEWRSYAREKHAAKPTEPEKPKGTQAIPILPIDTIPLLEVRGVAAIPIHRPKVVDVRYEDGRLHRGDYRSGIDEYWTAVGGPRYNADRIYVMDLGGIEKGKPDFDILRFVAKRTEAWMDLGVRRPEDVMDGFMVDAESVVAGTMSLTSIADFREIHELSEGVVPCIDLADGVVWSPISNEDRDLRRVARGLADLGFTQLAVLDLTRLGTFSGPSSRLVSDVAAWETEVYLGGGVREEDISRLKEAGLAGGLVDPFTPVIRSIFPEAQKEKPTLADAPQPRPTPTGSPAPS